MIMWSSLRGNSFFHLANLKKTASSVALSLDDTYDLLRQIPYHIQKDIYLTSISRIRSLIEMNLSTVHSSSYEIVTLWFPFEQTSVAWVGYPIGAFVVGNGCHGGARTGVMTRRSEESSRSSWGKSSSGWIYSVGPITSSFSTSMMTLHVLTTKCWMKVSVTTGTPVPTKPSGQNDASMTFPVSVRVWDH